MSLEVKKIKKTFGAKKVLDNFSGIFNDSSLTLLNGPNGSGKTTLLKIIAGLVIEDEGQINYKNYPLRDTKLKIAYCNNNYRSFFQRISCLDNLIYFGCINGLNKSDLMALLKDFSFFDLNDFIDKPVNQISLGQIQILILIRALMIKPSILLIDEVGSNIDDSKLHNLNITLSNYIKETKSIFIMATHNFHFDLGVETNKIYL